MLANVARWQSRRSARNPSWCFASGLAALLVLGGCGDSSGSTNDAAGRASEGIDASSAASLADTLGCEDVSELDGMLAPIRGNAATSGLRCTVDGEVLHIFARAPIGNASAHGREQGGTVENIRRLVGAVTVDPTCEPAVLISDDLFVVGSTTDQLADLGIAGEAPIPASPTVSDLEDCTIG
jgi:hypothetical protein